MKHFLYLISFVLLVDLCFQNCANPGRPTGGPKDTIPPSLIYSNPTKGTTNYKGSTIELEFSELINADKLKQQLIITPSTDIKYKSIVKRNKLILKLEGILKDSTTYNFNFANGVTDITEKNPSVNLSIALSTGPYIDSMSVTGTVEELMNKEPAKGYVVALYPFTDTLNVFLDKPMYFTTADEAGSYEIKYIKTGKYKIISFEDDNGNFLLDPDIESHGFLSDTIQLDSAISLRPIRCLLQNIKPLTLINARPTGRYVEIKFNKQVDNYNIQPSLPSNIIGEKKDIIRLYKSNHINYQDSITSTLHASDSLGNQILDTIKYVFLESNRNASQFSYSFKRNTLDLVDNPKIKIGFNKPILSFDTSKISIKSDSLLNFHPLINYNWNENNTELNLQVNLSVSLADSLLETIIFKDSSAIDSTNIRSITQKPTLSLFAEKGAFISVESDTSSEKSVSVKTPTKKSTGVLKVNLNTTIPSFRFQLLDKSGKVAYQKSNTTSFTLPSVKPGEYKIRVLIDNNNNGKWSYGNLLKNEEPEDVFLYEQSTSIRENWVVELNITI
ncbi:Ig-like domain-containing domain [Ekhidna sp.]|uniref:Ig-like domain-containing domain n=1 Tax=Ekhidna sp. TaxID=2608089 RepID=UPI0032996EE2